MPSLAGMRGLRMYGSIRWIVASAVLATLSQVPATASRADDRCGIACKCSKCGNEIDFKPIADAARSRGDRLLFLSGGGSYGAWGAGVIYGDWLRRSWELANDAGPGFAAVTGVSTGGLMASLAFLGTKSDMDALKWAYTRTRESDIQRRKLFPFFSDSIFSREPLRELVDELLEQDGYERFRRIAREPDKKHRDEDPRELQVGTVSLDDGHFCIWDLRCIAASGELKDAYPLFRDVIMATANAPGVGPPVEICGDLHVDGGVSQQIFAMKIEDAGVLSNRDSYFLVNGVLKEVPPSDDRPRRYIVDLASRGLSILTHEALVATLHYHRKYNSEGSIHLSRIPDGYPLEFESRRFPVEGRSKLFARGCAWAMNNPSWVTWLQDSPGEPPEIPDQPYDPTMWIPDACL